MPVLDGGSAGTGEGSIVKSDDGATVDAGDGAMEGQDDVPINQSGDTLKENTTIAENKTSQEKVQEAVQLAVADGTYSEKVTYNYHSGNETVEFEVSVENDTISDVSIAMFDPHDVSRGIITKFANALPDLVVGKKISDIQLPKNVAGSSLTSAAFQQYLGRLIEQN